VASDSPLGYNAWQEKSLPDAFLLQRAARGAQGG